MDPIVAKQFLISRVAEEAAMERVELSDVEKKMLHFTEAGGLSPEMASVVAQFETHYDSDEYESKIVGLLKNAYDRDLGQSLQTAWDDAISALKAEDHYILVMVHSAFPHYRRAILPTHRVRDYVIYIAIGIGVVAACVGLAMWKQ